MWGAGTWGWFGIGLVGVGWDGLLNAITFKNVIFSIP
jgi:hypothetical protein